ncbi:MAG: carboxypeptidase regulatory-like domain-containing protein, partial [Thermoplasmatales archaeon]|nr:carboxypeptidase regulatory-like domain-containing protein [Thermoplasmatales archaeon]
QLETSTHMFLLPLELVTITTISDVISGELAFLPDIFRDYVGLIPIFSVLGCLSITSGMFFKAFNHRRFYILSLVFASLSFVGSTLIFFIGMSTLTEVGVGGFIGKGPLDVSIPGKDIAPSVSCSWGPSLGFYLYVISIVILFIVIIGILSKKYFKSK